MVTSAPLISTLQILQGCSTTEEVGEIWKALESSSLLLRNQIAGGGEGGFSRLFSFSDMQAISSVTPPLLPAFQGIFLAGILAGAQHAYRVT